MKIRPFDSEGLEALTAVTGERRLITLAPKYVRPEDLQSLLDRDILILCRSYEYDLRPASLQKFASVHANVHNHFNLDRRLITCQTYKIACSAALAEWQDLQAWLQSEKR